MATEKTLFKGKFNYEAFQALFDNYYVQIKNFVYYKTASIETAEDIAQECFIKIWEKKDRVNPTTAKSYLYTIAFNLSIDHLKKQNLVFKFLNSRFKYSDNETPLFLLEEKEFDEQLQKAMGALEEKQRVVFLMNRIDKLTYNEIATRLSISVKTVEQRMSNALKSLKTVISQKI